ncbi:MAG: phosphomethylpyrimidine synthase ThiC, partial [Syntrophus sp. (in: bacteria)]
MTQIDEARQGVITEEMKICAGQEGRDPEFIRAGVADGTIVVIRNNRHGKIPPIAIGKGLRTKI